MTVNLTNIAAASFTPGLQNNGVVSGTALINGTIPQSPSSSITSNLTGSFVLILPDPTVVSVFRINLPDSAGDLANYWFPLMGTAELKDSTNLYTVIFYVLSNQLGREISFNFVNLNTSAAYTLPVNYRVNVYGHLYSYPWAQ